MALMDFIKKQFIDILQWTEGADGVLAWRFPMAEMEIEYGASLTVRESQMAVFVNEGKVADVFAPGMYKLTTQTLPVLTYLKNWDTLFESPFKSDVYFFSTRQQVDQRWGTAQPVTIRDKDFGAVRLRAFGNYSYRIADPRRCTKTKGLQSISAKSHYFMTKLILAILIQIIVFGIYFYIDARQTTAPDWATVVRFGLHPLALLYFAFSVFPIW